MSVCFATKEEVSQLQNRVDRLEKLVKQFCYDTECARIEQIAIEAKRKAIQVESDLLDHKKKSIPAAHNYAPKVKVVLSGSFYQNNLNISCSVNVDNASSNDSENIPIFLSALKGDKGNPGKNGRDGKDGKDGRDGKDGKDGKNGKDIDCQNLSPICISKLKGKDGRNGKDGKDGKNGKDGKHLIVPVGVTTTSPTPPNFTSGRGGRGANGKDGKDGRDGKDGENLKISCGLNLSFNPVSCVLTANLKINECNVSASVNMLCTIQTIINEIRTVRDNINNNINSLPDRIPVGGGGDGEITAADFTKIICETSSEEILSEYREITVTLNDPFEALQFINEQITDLQKKSCNLNNNLIKKIYKILGGDIWYPEGSIDPCITLNIEEKIRELIDLQWGLQAEKTAEALELKNVIDVVSGFLSCNYFRAGHQEYPFNVVEDVSKIVDEDTIKKINYQSQFDEWRFKQLDALFGQFPIKIKIEDNDLIKTGDEPLEIELPNLAETLAELTGKTLFNEAMLNLLVNINFRLLNEQGSAKLQGFSTNKMVEEIVDYLGFENQKIKEKIRFLYNPSYEIKEGEQPSFEEILKETEIDVDVEECTEKQSFEQKLDQLLFSAAIVQTALYEKVNPNNLSKWADFVKEYKNLVDAFSENKKKEDDELNDFIEKVEEGFTGETGISDPNNPYGRPRDQRPRIRKIGNPNSNNGGNNGGN